MEQWMRVHGVLTKQEQEALTRPYRLPDPYENWQSCALKDETANAPAANCDGQHEQGQDQR